MSKTTVQRPAESLPIRPTPPQKFGKLPVVLCVVHLVVALLLILNWLTHDAPLAGGETVHQQFAYQAAEPGFSTYGQLSPKQIPLWYPPLQFELAGWLSRPVGYDLRVMRASVAVFGVGSFFLVALLTRRLTGDWGAGLAAAGIFAGLPLTTPWYVVLEPNAGHVFFLLLALWLLMRDDALGWRTVVMAGASLFLCCWTKHTGLAYMVAGCFYIFCRSPKKGLVAAAVSFGLLAAAVAWVATRPGSMFLATMAMHKNDMMDWGRLLAPVLFPEYTGRVGVLFALAAAAIFSLGWVWRRLLTPIHVLMGAAFIVGTFARLKYGSGPTQAVAFYGLLCIYGVSFLHEKLRTGAIPSVVAGALLAVQGLAVTHDIRSQFITSQDQARYRELLEILRTPGKSAYFNCYGFLNTLVGKEIIVGPSWACRRDGMLDRSLYPKVLSDYWSKDPMDIVIIDIPAEDNSWFLYERLNANYTPVQELHSYEPHGQPQFGSLRGKKIVLMRKDQIPAQPAGGTFR